LQIWRMVTRLFSIRRFSGWRKRTKVPPTISNKRSTRNYHPYVAPQLLISPYSRSRLCNIQPSSCWCEFLSTWCLWKIYVVFQTFQRYRIPVFSKRSYSTDFPGSRQYIYTYNMPSPRNRIHISPEMPWKPEILASFCHLDLHFSSLKSAYSFFLFLFFTQAEEVDRLFGQKTPLLVRELLQQPAERLLSCGDCD
jgi:hypothetical protein